MKGTIDIKIHNTTFTIPIHVRGLFSALLLLLSYRSNQIVPAAAHDKFTTV